MQEPSWIFILFAATITLAIAAAAFSYLRTKKDQEKGTKSKLGNN